MTCRDLSQPSFVEAFVSGYAKGGGFLQDIDEAFDWGAIEVLLSLIHGSTKGAPGYPPLAMFKIILLQQWYTLRPRRRGGGARPAVVSALLRHPLGPRDTGPFVDLAVSPDPRQPRPLSGAIGRSQPAARGAWSHRQARHAGRRHPDRGFGAAAL